MSEYLSKASTAFGDQHLLFSGPLVEVALAVKNELEKGSLRTFLVFDDMTGSVIDLDLRGSDADVVERLSCPPQQFTGRYATRRDKSAETVEDDSAESKGRGRPKLGVVAREVTLLPSQWDWLTTRPGSASAILRRLVDEAMHSEGAREQKRAAHEAAYQFMQAIAGDLPGYEEGIRALFADNRTKLEQCIAAWPVDIKTHALRLAFGLSDQPTKRATKAG
ncbi:hypothetical protein HL670_02416 [Serratia plymuthica]|uniref:DUF2239 family protein n=1 Tax=Serratia plymuthica TaxID=82996 RepID=UPI00055B47D1|nr:DUF2239 family protein [Serratia plymuthica]ANJ95766.1 hypothetical protein ADP72_23340 [Serratia plymuthica]MBI6136484.1 DUF2239 family protein [Serratia plymuthica]NIC28321.1 DUF2239 family protein [Serratia plymuthica]QJW55530.1 hypothetical protein HL670_02416 [Serratia plymuthica]